MAGALFAAAPAGAASTGFHVYNLSASPMKLVNVVWDGKPETGPSAPLPPKVGSTLMPGEAPLHVEIAYDRFNLARSSVDLYFRPMSSKPNDLIVVDLHDAFRGADCHADRPYQCRVEGSEKIMLLDPPGTVHDVSAGNKQEQADVLNRLCNTTNSARCTFTPGTRVRTLTPSHIVGEALINCGDTTKTDTRVTRADKVGTTNSFSMEVGEEISGGIGVLTAKASLTWKYGKQWLDEHTFTQDVHLTVKPASIGWVAATQPVLRDTGDFTLELGNTTWNLRDVFFETPDPRPNEGAFVTDGYKLLPDHADEYASTCTHKRPGLTQVSANLAEMQSKGTSDHDLLVSGDESHTVRGLAGNDVLRGGPGHDTLNGGRHDDTLDGGRGRDTLNGGPGEDTMIDDSGPTRVRTGADTGPGRDSVDVRDGRGDDTVICGSRRSTVMADAGDRVVGRCGSVSRGAPDR